jgi:hypothetical protein
MGGVDEHSRADGSIRRYVFGTADGSSGGEYGTHRIVVFVAETKASIATHHLDAAGIIVTRRRRRRPIEYAALGRRRLRRLRRAFASAPTSRFRRFLLRSRRRTASRGKIPPERVCEPTGLVFRHRSRPSIRPTRRRRRRRRRLLV